MTLVTGGMPRQGSAPGILSMCAPCRDVRFWVSVLVGYNGRVAGSAGSFAFQMLGSFLCSWVRSVIPG